MTEEKTELWITIIKWVFACVFATLGIVASFKLWGWWGVAFLFGMRAADWSTQENQKLIRKHLRRTKELMEESEILTKKGKAIHAIIKARLNETHSS